MDFDEQTDAFTFEVDNLVERYLNDFDINLFTIVGVLEAKQQELLNRGNIDFQVDDDDNLDFLSDIDND